jgi:hypothetical protein
MGLYLPTTWSVREFSAAGCLTLYTEPRFKTALFARMPTLMKMPVWWTRKLGPRGRLMRMVCIYYLFVFVARNNLNSLIHSFPKQTKNTAANLKKETVGRKSD